MKNLITVLSILFISSGLFAQEKSKFQSAMEGTLLKMGAAKTIEAYQSVANTFGRIAANEPSEWAPLYYQTFIKTFQAFEAKDKAAAASELAALSPSIEGILVSDKANDLVKSEAHALLAMMYSARMMENPMVLGAKFGPLNAEHTQKAIELNEKNPRAYLLQAQTLFYTPEAFGGDKVKAKELTIMANRYFDLENESEPKDFMPRWGKEQAEQLIKSMK